MGPEVVEGSVAQLLQTYGPWGIVAIQFSVIGYLWKAYVAFRDKRDVELQEQTKGAIALVEECTRSSTEQKLAAQQIVGALQAIERRLEGVEKKAGRYP